LTKDNSEYDFYSRKNDPTGTGNSIYRELTSFYSDEQVKIIKKQGIKLDDLFEPDSIKKLNGGVVDTRYPVNWQHYRNCILLTQHNEIKQLNTKIFKIVEL
jgi:hypothetical protein